MCVCACVCNFSFSSIYWEVAQAQKISYRYVISHYSNHRKKMFWYSILSTPPFKTAIPSINGSFTARYFRQQSFHQTLCNHSLHLSDSFTSLKKFSLVYPPCAQTTSENSSPTSSSRFHIMFYTNETHSKSFSATSYQILPLFSINPVGRR